MSTTTLTKAERPQYRAPEYRTTFAGLLRSEWIKFWSVRSIVWTMIAAVVCVVGLGALISWATAAAFSDPETAAGMQAGGFDPTAASLVGAQFGMLIVAAVGVIVIAGEYATGMIRTSFVASPGRLGVFAAKALVLSAAVALVLGAAVFAAFLIGQVILDTQDVGVGIGDEGVLRALVGNVVVLVGIALAGLGLGALMRNTAGAVCTILALLFVVPIVLMLVPDFPGKDTISEYYFANTATPITSVAEVPGTLSLTAGAIAFSTWVVAFLAAGVLVLKRRDV